MTSDAQRFDEEELDVQRSLSALRLMADVSTVLGSSLDSEDVLRRLARLLVPALADWCSACRIDGGVRRVAVVHRDPEVEAPPGAEGPLPEPDPVSKSPVERVMIGEGPLVVTDEPEPDSALSREHRELTDALGRRTEILVPLQARRRVLGVLSLMRTAPERTVNDDDLVLVEDLAHRAALALDNALLYAAQRDAAQNFQRALLPELPEPDSLHMAARYAPAHEGAEVGGDWYDAFVLPDGVTALAIGDVSGHDLAAAVQMSRMQSMLRTLAWDHQEPPSAILRRLDGLLEFVSAQTATAVFGRIEGERGGPHYFHWSNAGHFPPLLVTEDGQTRFLESGHDVLLGVGRGWERIDTREELPPGAKLLLYTDGLVERRGEEIDRGMVRLRREAAHYAGESVDALCDGLLENLPESAEDDVVLLAVRIP
ncbi:PP2C family protein-serine/threonine phosphatase [Streptomonospora litoralis]|uniref:protein-serine/threonine phosphatase n=1 Tax=Streptomonospora litoralis TaxID=2498135 RepID=A0A4P6Q3V0_9ACTN|nr:SpoIIE family protein phosphatase [Streptomonospora litoralis]QBI53579.1 Phosphoserine phosphatase RsbU [Streptomonospora litoralis]